LDSNLLIEWIQVLEWIFAFQGYSDEKAFKVAVLKLKGVASHWYENVQRQRAREGRARIRTWSKLQKLITKRFLSTDFEHDLLMEMAPWSITMSPKAIQEVQGSARKSRKRSIT